MDKIYVVTEEYRDKNNSGEHSVKGTFKTREGAENRISELKRTINKHWADRIDLEDGWDEEVDEPGQYTLADTTDYEHFYEVKIEESPLED